MAEDMVATRRALILCQSADFFHRFDVTYGSLPHSFFKLRLPRDQDATIQELTSKNSCCGDSFFSKKILSREDRGVSLLRSPEFTVALQSMDLEDSSVSVLENERQHGRMRMDISYACSMKSVVQGRFSYV